MTAACAAKAMGVLIAGLPTAQLEPQTVLCQVKTSLGKLLTTPSPERSPDAGVGEVSEYAAHAVRALADAGFEGAAREIAADINKVTNKHLKQRVDELLNA